MSLTPPAPLTPLSLSATDATEWSSTAICQKLLYVCYYYSRCFGMTAFGITRCKETHTKNGDNTRETRNISRRKSEIPTLTNSPANAKLSQSSRAVLQAYAHKSLLWFHFVIRVIFCTFYTCAAFSMWLTENYVFAFIIYSQTLSISICSILMAIVEIWHRRRLIRALNSLMRLWQAIDELHCCYEIFQWTHVVYVALIIVTLIYEIFISMQNIFVGESWIQIGTGILQSILHIGIWLNLHVATLLYICVEAMYGTLNHYMKHKILLRLKVIQPFGPISTSTQIKQLTVDLVKFIGLFNKVHCVGLELHYLWQLPVACTLVSIYLGTISVIYYMIWQSFETDIVYVRFVPLSVKLVFDITLLSLAAHRAIKSSQLIGCMGLENVVLVENPEWHRQMEQFLYHINLYHFKLNCLGLFNINNTITLTFISGILTSISVFVPFIIKAYRIQKFLEKQN